jgi:hypothetical protein
MTFPGIFFMRTRVRIPSHTLVVTIQKKEKNCVWWGTIHLLNIQTVIACQFPTIELHGNTFHKLCRRQLKKEKLDSSILKECEVCV